jgi:hypothetical protein
MESLIRVQATSRVPQRREVVAIRCAGPSPGEIRVPRSTALLLMMITWSRNAPQRRDSRPPLPSRRNLSSRLFTAQRGLAAAEVAGRGAAESLRPNWRRVDLLLCLIGAARRGGTGECVCGGVERELSGLGDILRHAGEMASIVVGVIIGSQESDG